MIKIIRKYISNIPFVKNNVAKYIRKKPHTFDGTVEYWDLRYKFGGVSGGGSYGEVAIYKADFLNYFVSTNNIETTADFGCGDGNQLSLARYNKYFGLDVSETIVKKCATIYTGDDSKKFIVYKPTEFVPSITLPIVDLCISLEVIFHLVEDELYELYLQHLFGSSKRFVIIFADDVDNQVNNQPHIVKRKFTNWIDKNKPEWVLREVVKTPKNIKRLACSDFFIYEKIR